MGKGGGQTIGYHYCFSLLFGLGRWGINELTAIKVGDKVAWESHMCGTGPNAINKPNLFGGEEKEGGIQGPFYLNTGEPDQLLPVGVTPINVNTAPGSGIIGAIFAKMMGPYGGSRGLPDIKQSIGGPVSELRGVTTLWFDGLISSMNPYPKTWKFRVRRYSKGWHNEQCWYETKSVIFLDEGRIHAMNPAHIIYQCLTDPSWGRGLDPELYIDENSFIYAANTLCEEGFGLCMAWQRKEDIDTFIGIVLDHIGAVLYLDPETGKETLRLIRDDYVYEDLPIFAPGSGLIEITEDDSASGDTAFNEVIGMGHDPITDEDFSMRVHNLAARYSNGASNADDKKYPAIPTRGLLGRVIQRDLRMHASGLKKLTVVLDRSGYKIRPGMPFRIQDTRRGIADMVLRAGEVEDVSYSNGRITVKTLQDVFSLPATSFVAVPDQTWDPPSQLAEPALAERLIESGYRDVLLRGGRPVTDSMQLDDAFVGQLATAPNGASYEYILGTRVVGEPNFEQRGTGSFTGSATLAAAITPLQTTFTLADITQLSADNIGEAVLIDDEMMELVDFDDVTFLATVTRGNVDTIPVAHALGARLWTIDDDLVPDGRTYVTGETVESIVLTKTNSDILSPDESDITSIVTVARQARPYPPGNVLLDGEQVVIGLHGIEHPEPIVTWAHRDRVMQEDQLIDHLASSIGPEAGTTYTLRFYDEDGVTLLRTEAGIVGNTFTYTAAMILADGDPTFVFIELESVRDTLPSWQKYRFKTYLKSGFGIGWGENWGGGTH